MAKNKGNRGASVLNWIKGVASLGSKKKHWSSTESQSAITIGGSGDPQTSGTAGTQGADYNPMPLIGHWTRKSQYTLGFGLLAVNLLLAGSCVAFYYSGLQTVSKAGQDTFAMEEEIQRIAKVSQRVAVGDKKFFAPMVSLRDDFAKHQQSVRAASDTFDEHQAVKLNRIMDQVAKQWRTADRVVTTLSTNEKMLLSGASTLTDGISLLQKSQDSLGLVFALQVQQGSTAGEQHLTNYADMTIRKMVGLALQLSASDTVSYESLLTMQTDLKTLKAIITALSTGGKFLGVKVSSDPLITAAAKEALASFDKAESGFAEMAANGSKLISMKKSSFGLISLSDEIAANLAALEAEYQIKKLQIDLRAYIASFFGLLGVLSFGLVILVNLKETQKQAAESKMEQLSTQNAIMRLLDEMGDLADGDLTIRATVSEEITGAIADSVNFAITQLADLVGQIQIASDQIQQATSKATVVSEKLLKINAAQKNDITETGASVLRIAQSISEVSKRMDNSRAVSEQSVSSAQRGMEAITTSIESMKSIQDNVVETGKRIRRLTDQSQQISEIVELIADISEQTSVLAINATVQATKAGEAGKGFKVVADAVQDLANRASDATRRIGALINATQTDIYGASMAMEKTTEEAVRGGKLAETTGEALEDIMDVALTLSEIVSEINEQVNTSASAASDVSKTMKKVLESVNESSDSTITTTGAIVEINRLSEKLRDSVSGFKV